MATLAIVPVSEYLATRYRPDRDYIDGEVKERALGEKPHSGLQLYLGFVFRTQQKTWGLRAYTEQRVQVSPTRYRIPDVCAVTLPAAAGGIIVTAPLLCIEILSPEDSLGDMQDRVDDYLTMGVVHIWLIDPVRRLFWMADGEGFHSLKSGAFAIEGTQVCVTLAEINQELDDIAAGR